LVVTRQAIRDITAVAVLSVTNFLVVFDGLVVTVALPAIQRGLGFTQLTGQWVITVYTLALGSAMVLGGRCGDRFGRRRVLTIGLSLFSAGVLSAAAAPDQTLLLVSRAAQGIGSALAVPNTYALINSMESPVRRRRVFTATGLAGSGGSACGAILGGAVAQGLGWRYVFLLSAPFAIAAAIGSPLVLDAGRTGVRGRLDAGVAMLAIVVLVSFIYGITNIDQDGIGSPATLLSFAGAVVAGTCYVLRERHARMPLLPAELFGIRALRAAILGMPGQVFAFNGTVYLALLYFQQVQRYGALLAGAAFAPLGAAAFVGAPIASRLLGIRRWTMVAAPALLVAASGLAILAFFAGQRTSYLAVTLPALLLIGLGIAIAAVTLNAAAGRDVPPDHRGASYGLFETSTHVSGAIAVAVLATVVAAGAKAAGSSDHIASMATGFRLGFAVATVVALLTAICTVVFGHERPEEHRPPPRIPRSDPVSHP
jgi:MFS family permease